MTQMVLFFYMETGLDFFAAVSSNLEATIWSIFGPIYYIFEKQTQKKTLFGQYVHLKFPQIAFFRTFFLK